MQNLAMSVFWQSFSDFFQFRYQEIRKNSRAVWVVVWHTSSHERSIASLTCLATSAQSAGSL